jgi:hypothetical protein
MTMKMMQLQSEAILQVSQIQELVLKLKHIELQLSTISSTTDYQIMQGKTSSCNAVPMYLVLVLAGFGFGHDTSRIQKKKKKTVKCSSNQTLVC